MEEFKKIYTHLYASLAKFNIPLQYEPDDITLEVVAQLHPVFRIISAQVERDTVDDHVFLFMPLITEENFFKMTSNNRKVLLAYVKKLFEVQEIMELPEQNVGNQMNQLLSSLNTEDLDATAEDIESAATSLGETLGLEDNDPLKGIMRDIIHSVGDGLKNGNTMHELIENASKNFQGRLKDDLQQGSITKDDIIASQQKMMGKMEKLMRNPMAAMSALQSKEQKAKAKKDRRQKMREKWRKKNEDSKQNNE